MKFYLKDYRNKIHKISFSSRDELRTQLSAIGDELKQLYREKSLYDETLKSIRNRLMNIEDNDANQWKIESMIRDAEHADAIKYDIMSMIDQKHLLVSDINPEEKLSVKNFLGTGYRFELPEIYEENLEEMGALIETMIGSL